MSKCAYCLLLTAHCLLNDLWKILPDASKGKLFTMKVLMLGLLALSAATCCNAQTKTKTAAAAGNTARFEPPIIVKNDQRPKEETRFTPPIIRKNKTKKTKSVTQFNPPVIRKDR
jgi:hypothetical protein